jgi:hypothetical protein
MESVLDAMVSAKISFLTQGPKRIQKSTPTQGNAVVDLHDRITEIVPNKVNYKFIVPKYNISKFKTRQGLFTLHNDVLSKDLDLRQQSINTYLFHM